MKIVILSPSDRSFIARFLPNEKLSELPIGYNGASFIGTIIQEYLECGHEVVSITTTPALKNDYTIKKYTYENFTWVVVPKRPHSVRLNGNKIGRILDFYHYEIKKMAQIIKEINPEIVHAHWSYEFAGAAIKSKLPNLITVHDNALKVFKFYKTLYRFGKLLMSELFLRQVKYTSTVSPYMVEYLKKKTENVKLIPNPIKLSYTDNEVSLFINKRLNSLDTPKIVMINNGWGKLKNGKLGLLAFKEFKKKSPHAQLHLFGSGSEKSGLAENDAISLKLDGVFYHGSVSNIELLNELENYHILLHTSLEESFGVVLIEAMSLGIPCIGGRNSGAVPWVIENNELLTDVSSPETMCNTILKCIDNYEEYATKAYQNVKNRFSVQKVTTDYLNYYKEIVDNY